MIWALILIIAASLYSAIRWGTDDTADAPENDPDVRARMAELDRQREGDATADRTGTHW